MDKEMMTKAIKDLDIIADALDNRNSILEKLVDGVLASLDEFVRCAWYIAQREEGEK